MMVPLRNDLGGYSSLGGRDSEPSLGDVGSGSHPTQSKCLVQCCGTGKEKG